MYHNTLDHILTLDRSEASIETAGAIHHTDNMSDHEPIYAIIKVPRTSKSDDEDNKLVGKPKPVWRNATDDQKLQYNDILFR